MAVKKVTNVCLSVSRLIMLIIDFCEICKKNKKNITQAQR